MTSARLRGPEPESGADGCHPLTEARRQGNALARSARAKAERRRAEAIAEEQQMKAKVAENRSQLVLAEAQVPMAMAEAFKAGRISPPNSQGA